MVINRDLKVGQRGAVVEKIRMGFYDHMGDHYPFTLADKLKVAEQVSLSPSAVLRRVKRLEESRVIDRYVALVKPESVGLGLTAHLNVRLEKQTESHKRNPMDLLRACVSTPI